MSDFEVVDPTEVPQPGRQSVTPLSLALMEGQTVFVPGWTHADASGLRSRGSYVRARGLNVSTRAGEREGVKGLYIWTIPSSNGKHP